MNKSVLIVATLTLFTILSCKKEIKTVDVGDMVWMQNNLDINTFANGDKIPEIESDKEWEEYGEKGWAAWCYYDNDPTNGKVLGRLYNWHAVNDSRGLCPEGWHIPTDEEWTKLTEILGGSLYAGEQLKSDMGWKLGGEPGTNSSKIAILPGGTRNKDGFFNSAGRSAYLWSSTPINEWDARDRGFEYNSTQIVRDYSDRGIGFSCRCVKD